MPLVLLSAFIDHFAFGTDDWRKFDRHTVRVQQVIDGESFRTTNGAVVRLLGVSESNDVGADYLRKFEGHELGLKLDVPQTRDEQDRLAAYVYSDQTNCINVDLIRRGLAKADRSTPNVLDGLLVQAQSEAKRKRLGLWAR